MKQAIIYIHGKGGSVAEAEHYKPLFPNCEVIGFDYKSNTPWDAKKEFSEYFDFLAKDYDKINIIANSIGAFFALHALGEKPIEKAYLISPVVDMEGLIHKMMSFACVTEQDLFEKQEIETPFGETLSWKYLTFVKNNPVSWNIPTKILYGEKDELTPYETVLAFSKKIGASLTVMQGGEHWFHTENQMAFLDKWCQNS